jgi:hypothetical protein
LFILGAAQCAAERLTRDDFVAGVAPKNGRKMIVAHTLHEIDVIDTIQYEAIQ